MKLQGPDTVQLGNSYTFTCSVTGGIPAPAIKWTVGGEEREAEDNDEGQSVLTLDTEKEEVTETVISCKAENSEGVVSESLSVNTEYRPKSSKTNSPNSNKASSSNSNSARGPRSKSKKNPGSTKARANAKQRRAGGSSSSSELRRAKQWWSALVSAPSSRRAKCMRGSWGVANELYKAAYVADFGGGITSLASTPKAVGSASRRNRTTIKLAPKLHEL